MKIKKITLINILTTVLMQICSVISGLIIPRLILSYFGSSVNGLCSSILQFLNYISILEGGISGVVLAYLYKPLIENDEKKVSSILRSAQNFYKKIGLIFIFYSLLVGFFYPLIFRTGFNYFYVFSLTLILSINLIIQYMFCLSYKALLEADKKIYIISITQICITILNIIVSYISLKIYPNIHIFKFLNGFVFIIQPIFYSFVVKKYYKIDKNVELDNNLIKNRWSGFTINLAAFVHFGTDIIVLTIFTDLMTVSIYSVYNAIVSGLQSLIMSATNGINATIGQAYAVKNFDELNKKMDLYEYIVFVLVFLIFSTASILLTPFVMIYTNNISDTNYYQPILGYLLLISSAVYLLKFPHLNLSYSANKFKEITRPAIIEAIINIIISILFVKIWGSIGVAIGTIVAMIYRLMFHVDFTTKLINGRKQIIFYKKLFIFATSSIIGIVLSLFIAPNIEYTIGSWIFHGFIYFSIIAVILTIISLLFFKSEIKFILNYIKRRK